MKRSFSLLALFSLLACVPASQPPGTVTSDDLAPEPGVEEQAPGWRASSDRYASPPPGGERRELDAWRGPAQPAPVEQEHQAPRAAPPRDEGSARPTPPTEVWGAPSATPPPSAPSKGAAAEPGHRGSGGFESRADSSAELGYGDGGGGRAPRRSASADPVRPTPRPHVDERPGLGTSWGETRYSSVSEAPFERDSAAPTYSAALHYNDAAGARAMTGGGRYDSAARVNLGGALSVSLRDEYSSSLPAYRGSGRTVAVGEHGQRYTLVVQNHTNERFELVLSVDGLDVLDGRDASFDKRGYIIDPYGTLEIEGFRQSEDAVAAFRFGSVRDSYAARTGSARNVGVIGAAAFGERGYMARLRAYQERMYALRVNGVEIERRINADPFPNKYATPPLNIAR